MREPEDKLRDYALTVRSFDWHDFFTNWKGELFFDWLRRQLLGEDGYDVVLVDSRTGVTEMGGVCAYQLADVAVMLCAANYQNLEGTLAVARDFRSEAVLALRGGRPLEIVVVPARLEETHPDRDRFFGDLTSAFQSDGLPKVLADVGLDYRKLALPYAPSLAVAERLVGGSSTKDPAMPEGRTLFKVLTDALTLLATKGRLVEQRGDALARLSDGSSSASVETVADPTQRGAGFDVLIDYGNEDATAVAVLRERLEAVGFTTSDTFRDVRELREAWEEVVLRNLSYSENLLVVFGQEGTSPFRESILRRARERGKPRIIPVVMRPDLPYSLTAYGLDRIQVVHLPKWPAADDGLDTLIETLRSRSQGAPAPSGEDAPYPGGRPFGEDDAPFFFGRYAEIEHLFSTIRETDVVLLVGPSGVGKTSIVQAGVVPKLRRGEGLPQGDPPFNVRVIDFADADAPSGGGSFRGGQGSAPPADRQPFDLAGVETWPDSPAVLILDSVDSFPRGADPGRYGLVRKLASEANPTRKLVVVARGIWNTRPADTVLTALPHERMAVIKVDPLPPSVLREALEKPAGRVGHLLEPGLADRLLADAGTHPAAIAVAQLALPILWRDRRRGWLTNRAYDSSGGISELVRKQMADAPLRGELGACAQAFIANLVELDTTLRCISLQRPWSELRTIPALGDAVVIRDILAAQRVIALHEADVPGAAGPMRELVCLLTSPDPVSLFPARTVPRPELTLWRKRFSSYVASWRAANDDPARLLTGAALDEAETWVSSSAGELTEDERQLTARSVQARDRESERLKEREAEERRRLLARDRRIVWQRRILLVGLVLLIGMSSWFVVYFRTQQRQQRHNAITFAALSESERDPTVAAVMMRDLLREEPLTPRDRTALSRVLSRRLSWSVLNGHAGRIIDAAFSPDGDLVVTASEDKTARLWTREGRPVAPLEGHTDPLTAAAFSPDGQLVLTASQDETARLWTREGRAVATLEGHAAPVMYAAFSPDGQLVVTASKDKTARLWTREGRAVASLEGHKDSVWAAAFSGDGKLVVTASPDQTARLWTREGQQVATLKHQMPVWAAVFSPDGQLVLTASDETGRLWTRDGQVVATLKGHTAPLRAAAFSPDGNLVVTGSSDNTARLWTLEGGAVATLEGHTDTVYAAAFSPDGQLVVTGSWDKTARVWAREGRPVVTLGAHPVVAAFSPDGQVVVTGSPGETLRLWAREGRPVATLGGELENLAAAEFSPNGQLVVVASGNIARLWTRDGRAVATLDGHHGPVRAAAFSPDGQLVVTASEDNTARLWTREGRPLATLEGHTGALSAAAFSPDSQLVVTASEDHTARLWTREGRGVATLTEHTDAVWAAAFSPDGQLMVTASRDNTARLWTREGQEVATLKGHTSSVSTAAFSSDGQLVLTGSTDGTARLWTREGREVAILEGHRGPVFAAAFSPDGQLVVTAGDRTARLWTREGRAVATLEGHTAFLLNAAFSPDGELVLTVSAGDPATIWPIGREAFLSRIEVVTRGCLTSEQWEQLMFEERATAKHKADRCLSTRR